MQGSPNKPPKWHRLVDLGQELIGELDIAKQRDLILQAVTELAGGEATLWLAEAARPLPRTGPTADGEAPIESGAPRSAAMRRALERESAVVGKTSVALPLRAPGAVLGVLEVKRADTSPLQDDDIELLEGLVSQSATALQASRQIAVERWRLEQLSLVRQVSAEIADVMNLDDLTSRVTNRVLRTFGYYHVALFTLEPDEESLVCRGSAGPVQRITEDEQKRCLKPSIRLGQGIVGHVAQTGEEILAGDVNREPHYRHVDVLPETRSEAALPLKIEERVLGVLDVQSDQPERFDETDILVLRALADQIALAVEDARLYNNLRVRADQLSAVTEVSRVVASILDLDDLLHEVGRLIHDQFGYPYVHLFTINPGQQKVVYRAGWPPRPAETVDIGQPVCDLRASEGIVAWVACHGQPVLANDVERDARYRDLGLSTGEGRAQLAVPLKFGGEVLGILDIQSDRRGAFGDDDLFVFEALADSVAIAIRNANLYHSERWRRQVADSMRDVAGLLSSGIELDEVLDAVLDRLGNLLPCDASAIWLLRDETLCLSAVHGADETACISNSLSSVNVWLREALLADQPVVRTSSDQPEPLGATLDFDTDYSAIAAPLRAGERRLGILTLVHHTPNRYGSESRAMTAAFASYAAVAIENTRLFQHAQEQAYVSTVLLQVAEATQSLTTLDAVLETVVRLIPMLVGIERCALFLWDESQEAFAPAGACAADDEEQRALEQLWVKPSEVPAFNQLSVTREPVPIHNSAPASSREIPPPIEAFDSPLLLPLLAHGELLGALLIDYQREDEGPEPGDLYDERMTIMRGIAYQAAMAAENARLLEARQEEAYVSAALLQVAQAVVSLNELDEILEAIVRVTPMLVGIESCAVFLRSGEEGAFRAVRSYGMSLPDAAFTPREFPLLAETCEQNQVITVGRADRIAEVLPEQLTRKLSTGEAAVVAAPLSVKGDVLGALLVAEDEQRRGFDERRLEIITGIAQQAALAVQNDRLQQEMAERERLERELQLAREIQQTFMPERLPDLAGWGLSVTWRAARQVAGDFYDVFELPGLRLGLVIADVADKGMPAALFMALTRTLMRAAATEERSPAKALSRVNRLLVPDAQHGMFVTGLYVILSLETGDAVYANAGHHPPLVFRSDEGRLEQLERGETALGVLDGVQFQKRRTGLAPGDYMILYTDGVTEALSPDGVLYGERRLREVIQRSCRRDSAQETLSEIVDDVAAFVGDQPPSDDLTLMILRRDSTEDLELV